MLQAASASGIHKVGAATVDGTHTTEYRTTIDLSKLGSASGEPTLGSAIQQLEAQSHVTSLPVKVWLDGQKRVRRMTEDVRVPGTGAHRAASADITVDIPAFDVPVNVDPACGRTGHRRDGCGHRVDQRIADIAMTPERPAVRRRPPAVRAPGPGVVRGRC